MKITKEKGKIVATAETLEDINALLKLADAPTLFALFGPKPTKATREGTKHGGNRWKGKHRVKCELCGNSYKGINIHMKKAHEGTGI